MKPFDIIERKVFSAVERTQSNINIAGGATDLGQNELAELTDELHLSEPVTITILVDESGSYYYSSTSPIATHIITLAEKTVLDSTFSDQINDYQCRSLVSFPERLANKFAKSKNTEYTFNSVLFLERTSDAILLLYFTKTRHQQMCVGSLIHPNKLDSVLETLVSLLLRRGNLAIVMQRFSLLSHDLFQNARFHEQFSLFINAIYRACKVHRFFLKPHNDAEVSQLWHQWNVHLFLLMEKRPDVKGAIVKALSEIMNNFSTDNAKLVGRATFESIFVHDFFIFNSSRNSIRTAFCELLEIVAGNSSLEYSFTPREDACFAAIFDLWSSKAFVTSGNLCDNLSVLHPVMYTLLYIRKKYPNNNDFPQKYVCALLNGVSIRLDSTRGPELRTCAMTVAAAFAALYVSNTDGAAPLAQDPNFARALEGWMQEEPDNEDVVASTQKNRQISLTTERSEEVAAFARRAIVLNDTYPLDPEEKFNFFIKLEQQENHKISKKSWQDAAVVTPAAALVPTALPAFGQQKFSKDDLGDHVSILKSIRECYNAIVGVGRGPNAQMHEIQEATESGLRGLADAFAKLRDRIDSDLFRRVSKEAGPLIPTLLPALISLNIHAPDEAKQFLQQLRYNAIVDLILLNPLQSLNQLSSMVYRSNYGIYQRNELIKASGEAALFLSQVEIKREASQSQSNTYEENLDQPKKRIYPPIPTHQLSGKQKTAIIVTEGQQTRRWGSANVERNQRRANVKRYVNLLSEYAAVFIAAFLHKLDADHFAFFQDSDPYTPCAILDSLTIVFQGITNVRHTAPDLCEKNFDFFFAVCTQHPNLSVKKAAWTTVVEVMRTWCGVGPLWVRRKDGQRVLNRDAGLHHSLMFTKSWLNALALLQHACENMLRINDGCGGTALVAVSSLRDLVYDRSTFMSVQLHSEEVSLSN